MGRTVGRGCIVNQAQHTSVVEALLAQVRANPTKVALVFLDGDGTEHAIRYAQLGNDMHHAAQALHVAGVRPGDVVLLAYRHGYPLVSSFFGAIYLGAIPVILPYFDPHTTPPAYRGQVQQTI